MIAMSIKFHAKDDTTPALPGLDENSIIHVKGGVDLVVLEAGMESGKPSVALCVKMPDGKTLIAETTALAFCTASRAIMARYEDLFD